MAVANWNILDTFLDAYTSAISSGFGLISGDVTSVMGSLAAISIGLAAIFWMLDETENIIAPLIRQILKIGFFIWIVDDWQGLTETVVKGFTAIGLKAGGGGVSADTFLNSPSNIVVLGIKHALNQFNLIKELTGPIAFFDNFASIIILCFTSIGIIVAFFVIAVQLVVTLIEFRLVTLAAFILVPFGILNKTSFLAERSFGYVVSVGLKLLTISLVVAIGGKTFDNLSLVTLGDNDWVAMQSLSVLLAALLMMMLSLTIPAIASALVTGGPQLGAGAAVAGAAGMAAGAAGAYLGARGAMAAPGAVARAPGAIAAKAQAAAGQSLGKGFDQMASSLGAAPSSSGASTSSAGAQAATKASSSSGTMGGGSTGGTSAGGSPSSAGAGQTGASEPVAPSNLGAETASDGGGGASATPEAGGTGSSSDEASAASGSGTPLKVPPTEKMQSYAQSIASKKGVAAPDMSSGQAVRDFLDKNSSQEMGEYRSGGSGGAQSSAAANVGGTNANSGGEPASSASPVSSNAPPPDATLARAAARNGTKRSAALGSAQAAGAASNSQGGAGINVTGIDNEE